MDNEQFDFVAVGDITTDAFIRVKDVEIEPAHEGGDSHHSSPLICFNYGDKVEYEDVIVLPAVGNSPNAATSATRLGLKTALVTDIGDDTNGEDNVAQLKKNNVNTDYVRVHEGEKTNYHYVLWHKEERTILVKHEHYNYSFPELAAPRYLYLSSLAENSLPYHDEVITYLKTNPDTKMVFQPGTFQMKLGIEKLAGIYEHTHIFVCNKQEAQRILKSGENSEVELMKGIAALGPEIVCVTDGPNGAFTYEASSGEAWFVPMYPDPAPPVERTGAGDAFTSTFTAALSLGKSLPEALEWGPVNSMNVVQHVGAQEGLMTREEIEGWLEKRPDHYHAKRAN